MSRGWSPERRAKQAEAIKRWRPWERSTGPRTAEGKAASAANGALAWPLGSARSVLRELRRVLREQRDSWHKFELTEFSCPRLGQRMTTDHLDQQEHKE